LIGKEGQHNRNHNPSPSSPGRVNQGKNHFHYEGEDERNNPNYKCASQVTEVKPVAIVERSLPYSLPNSNPNSDSSNGAPSQVFLAYLKNGIQNNRWKPSTELLEKLGTTVELLAQALEALKPDLKKPTDSKYTFDIDFILTAFVFCLLEKYEATTLLHQTRISAITNFLAQYGLSTKPKRLQAFEKMNDIIKLKFS
jgi:hypothetical protein